MTHASWRFYAKVVEVGKLHKHVFKLHCSALYCTVQYRIVTSVLVALCGVLHQT
jgi:hypothetical protein